MGAVRSYMRNVGGIKASQRSEGGVPRHTGAVKTIHDRRLQLRRILKGQRPDPILNIASTSRVIIIEGISGSGKDTFQKHLRRQLKNRDVYEYSEGEVLQSWTHLPIKGICTLQVKILKLFLKYMKSILSENPNAVFLINRFHLSAYVAAVMKQPRLAKEYNECLEILRSMPVHIFILHVDDAEIEERTLHFTRRDQMRGVDFNSKLYTKRVSTGGANGILCNRN
jgi:thymidylate kinase